MRKKTKIKAFREMFSQMLCGTLAVLLTGFVGMACQSYVATQAELEVPNLTLEVAEDSPTEQVEEAPDATEAPEAEVAVEVVEQPSTVAEDSVPVGSCRDWMVQAGITDMDNAYILIMNESSCNPNAVNPTSGACGIGQQLPCGKWEHQWNDPVGAMIDMQNYVMNRYGSWANALQFHYSHNWY